MINKSTKRKPYYITFGAIHGHQVGKKIFDRDCVARVWAEEENEAREIAVRHFQLNGVLATLL